MGTQTVVVTGASAGNRAGHTGMFGVSGVTALYGVGYLLACAIIAISGAVAAWLAALAAGALIAGSVAIWRWRKA
jgi:membrane protein